MPFDFSKLPWKQWLSNTVSAGIWRAIMQMPWWLTAIMVAGAIAALAWLAGK